MLNKSVATVIVNNATNNNALLPSPNSVVGFTEIFNKNPNKIPATVVNSELSLNIES
jgi:hypothetical protein